MSERLEESLTSGTWPSRPSDRRWSLVPVIAIRQAGFPLDDLAPLVDDRSVKHLTEVQAAESMARQAAETLALIVRGLGVDPRGQMRSAVGLLRPLTDGQLSELRKSWRDPATTNAVSRYQDAVSGLDRQWSRLRELVSGQEISARCWIARTFDNDPLLRDVLLLSNDAHFPHWDGWLRKSSNRIPTEVTDRQFKRTSDLLVRYLQRVSAKNDTHSHFGPITTGLLNSASQGISWSEVGDLERVTFFTHWAGTLLGARFAAEGQLGEYVRPRRAPLTFVSDGCVDSYAIVRYPGIRPWKFTRLGVHTVDVPAVRLLGHCNGELTKAELRQWWDRNHIPGNFDQELNQLTAAGWVIATFEIPVGNPTPLCALRDQLPAAGAAVGSEWAHHILDHFQFLLGQFQDGCLPARPSILRRMKEFFEDVVERSPNRGHGEHYADRSIIYEECHGAIRGLRLGPDIERLLSDELAISYDLALAVPRLIMQRETEVLARWMSRRFGEGVAVPLARFLNQYFIDQAGIAAECVDIAAEGEEAGRHLVGELLGEIGPGSREVSPDRERLRMILRRFPAGPAVCNPDIMLAATDVAGIRRGEFLAVVGECHAVREALTHSSMAPLLAERQPSLLDEVVAAYRRAVPEEELCDVVRSHPDKTGTQLIFPYRDLELEGRSPKSPSRVLRPVDLWVMVENGQIRLRADGVARPLRLLAPFAGGAGIASDPSSVFSFPRTFGGTGLFTSHLTHVPRLRYGRVVLHRETWRAQPAELRMHLQGRAGARDDAALFFAMDTFRRHKGMPRHFFVRIPGQPKPLYVDAEAPLLVRQALRLALRATKPVEFSEMLPGPEHLWLEIAGRRYTSELRCAVFSRGNDEDQVQMKDDTARHEDLKRTAQNG